MNPRSNSERQPHATPLRTRLREAARGTILESAEAVFAERGIESARVEEIARRAGVSVGTLYNYFGDREGLVDALLEWERAELLDKADDALAQTEGQPFPEQLAALLDVTLQHFREHGKLFALLAEDELRHFRAMKRHRCVFRDMFTRVEKVTQRATRAGHLRPEHAALYPAAIVGTIKGLFARQVNWDDGKLPDVSGAQLVDLFLDGARARR